jgi:hypothetical protein
MVVGVDKRAADGTYMPEHLAAPLQLTWAYPSSHEQFPTIVQEDVCDLGFLDEGAGRFELAVYAKPNNLKGYVRSREGMRIHITAAGHDVPPSKPLIIEVAWDGVWSANQEEMLRHLVIREVKEKPTPKASR